MNEDCDTTKDETFQEPRKKFWLRSTRKRTKSDAISVCSMDISIDLDTTINKKKKRRRITEVASSIFSSVSLSNKPKSQLDDSFCTQASSMDASFINDDGYGGTLRKKVRNSEKVGSLAIRSWVTDIAGKDVVESMSRSAIKRQEAIYELFCGENVLLHDLYSLRDHYYEPLFHTGIFTATEMVTLFGDIPQLIEIHSKLRDDLRNIRDQDGYTEAVGPTILNWLPMLTDPYVERCRSQIWARHLLEEKRTTCRRFQEFLKKKLMEAAHLVDLWTYLDVPRSRVVKYPILIKEILRHTPEGHNDRVTLKMAATIFSDFLSNVDRAMGDAECKLAKTKISLKSDYDLDNCVENAVELIAEGQLKDQRGMKFRCFLFDTCFVLTRASRRPGKKHTISFPVIPKQDLNVSIDDKTQSGFKVGNHVLVTEDEHGRRHWIECFGRLSTDATVVPKDKCCEEKENEPLKSKTPTAKRRSTGGMHNNQLTLTLRRTLWRQKRKSIDCNASNNF